MDGIYSSDGRRRYHEGIRGRTKRERERESPERWEAFLLLAGRAGSRVESVIEEKRFSLAIQKWWWWGLEYQIVIK